MVSPALVRTLSSSVADLTAITANANITQATAENHQASSTAPSPIIDQEALKLLMEAASKSPDRLQSSVNAALRQAVSRADPDAVRVLFAHPECRPTPCTTEQAKSRAAASKLGSVGDFSDMSADFLGWAQRMRQVYNTLKKQPTEARAAKNQLTEARALTPPARL
jgi:hypothetical protein